ncbi:MAG: adenylate/guanylate cyclase domain-containing protein [Lachnospiraceae bacterium]|nr:adenylate/guanylate cyclase domain-containing protein [Lachnospiraceae bacterium]
MKKKHLREAAFSLLAAGILTLSFGLGFFRTADLSLSDSLYQERASSDGKIVLVGIDQKALEVYGPYGQWGRGPIAETLEILNASEDCHPAVIGIDILYSGESDPESDRRLAQAAGRYQNVITACAAEFGSALVEYNGDYSLSPHSVTAFNEPYEALKAASGQGHINAMLDKDGILRHHMLYLTLPDGDKVPSLALAAAKAYGGSDVAEPPIDGRGFWYLPFCGTPGDFSMISVSDILSGAVSPDYFDGKIVLIGPYAAGLQDSYLTSADHARPMYGVEYQANAIQALLWGDYKKEVSDGMQLAILFLFLALGFVLFRRCRIRVSVLLWAAFTGGWILLCLGLYRAGRILHVLWVPAGMTVLYAVCLATNYVRAALERQRVTNTFRRYVAPEIVAEILKEGTDALSLGGKLSTIAVLFVDVRGFTPMSEHLPPEKVVEILNQYLTLISDCILKNGGTLDKFVGDAAMAFWGAPLPQEDFVMQAARAARDMAAGSKELSEELLAKYGRTVSFGIGIHLGEAVVGNIGSPRRMDYTAIGDTVNTAARLEANAPGGKIYISRAVADALKGRISVTSLGATVPLKGKKEGFEVLTLDEIL